MNQVAAEILYTIRQLGRAPGLAIPAVLTRAPRTG